MVDVDPLDAYMATLDAPPVAVDAHATSVWSAVHLRAPRPSTQTRNRRFQRLQQLLAGSDSDNVDNVEGGAYFSDAMMQQRSPALFHFHLGQYLPAAAAAASTDPIASAVDEQLLLSTFLLRASDRGEVEARRVWEQRAWGAFVGRDEVDARKREKALFQRDDVEEEEEEDEEKEDDTDHEESKESEEEAAVSVDERRRLLVDLMAHRFLQGSDHEFVDYAAIDSDAALDDLEQMQRDAEDAYFDAMDED